MSPIPLLASISRISDNQEDVVRTPRVILSVYGFVLLPLALYALHDIVDNRWRPIHKAVRFSIAYILLYIVAATVLVWYIFLQWRVCNFEEVGAAGIALTLATYRVWTLLRLVAIISAHRRLVVILKKCVKELNELSVRPGPKKFKDIEYFLGRPPEHVYQEHLYIASSLFDDSYPGDSPRIRWLSSCSKKVHKDDLNECASRISVWMRVVLGNTNMRIWDELTESDLMLGFPSELSATQMRNSGKLYETFFSEFMNNMNNPACVTPKHLTKQHPAEALINFKEIDDQDNLLRNLGASIFWFARCVRDEEYNRFIATLPTRWTHQMKHTGRELMVEMGVILMLSSMKIPAKDSVGRLIPLGREELQVSRVDQNIRIWKDITDILVEAVIGIISRDEDDASSTENRGAPLNNDGIERVVEGGVRKMRENVFKSEKTEQSLYCSLVCIIRRAYYSAYIVDYMWKTTHMVCISCDRSQLYHAEIIFGLYHVVSSAKVGLCSERNLFNEKRFRMEKEKMPLQKCGCVAQESSSGVQKCPASVLRVFVNLAESAAQKVYESFFDLQRPVLHDPH